MDLKPFPEMVVGILTTRSVSLYLSLYFTSSDSLIPFVVQQFVEPTKIERWVVVNFSARCNVRQVVDDLIKIGGSKGIVSKISLLLFFVYLKTCL